MAHPIIVLADDLSGAAELAGIAANLGLKAEVHLKLDVKSRADFIALDTETRSMPVEEAVRCLQSVLPMVRSLEPKWIFKKTDSVLRGHVRMELEAISRALELSRVLFIPANPQKQRVIRNGFYFVNGLPLDRTVFGSDPDFPQKTADVIMALGCMGKMKIHSVGHKDTLPNHGIILPDIESKRDIRSLLSQATEHTLVAGAAEFFEELLKSRLTLKEQGNLTVPLSNLPSFSNALYLCGSLASWNRGIKDSAEKNGIPVSVFEVGKDWSGEVRKVLQTHGKAMMALGPASGFNSIELLGFLAKTAQEVVRQTEVDSIFLEGGATAHAWIRLNHWNALQAIPVNWTGVGCLKPISQSPPPFLFIKPGSYPWPEEAWSLHRSGDFPVPEQSI